MYKDSKEAVHGTTLYNAGVAKGRQRQNRFPSSWIFRSKVFLTSCQHSLQVYPGHRDRLTRWLAWSLLTGGLGALLSGGSQEGGWVPINKNLWSISFVLVTSCFAFALLAVLYVLIDLKHWWKGQPFFYAGET